MMIGIITNTNNHNFKSKPGRQTLLDNRRSIKRKKVKSTEDGTVGDSLTLNVAGNHNMDVSMAGKGVKRDWNSRGWIRVFCGPYRDIIDLEEASRMVNIASKATASDVARDMDLPEDYSLWLQIGGMTSRRLRASEHPFIVQEDFFKRIGITDASRRSRLAIDPHLKHLIRFYVGPAAPPCCPGVERCGTVELLKGLVCPQWRQRTIAIVGSLLLVYSGNATASAVPDMLDLADCDIEEHAPGFNRLILKITTMSVCRRFGVDDGIAVSHHNNNPINKAMTNSAKWLATDDGGGGGGGGSSWCLYNSSCSLNSNGAGGDRERVLFIGFEESWERDMWSAWLTEASNQAKFDDRRIDIAGSGLQAIPEVVMQSMDNVEELLAGQNQLKEIGLGAIAELVGLRVLRLPHNGFSEFPTALLNMAGLQVLDLSGNALKTIPDGLSRMKSLQELVLDRNQLIELPNSLRDLRHLGVLNVSNNRLTEVPAFLLKMRTLMQAISKYQQHDVVFKESNDQNYLNPPLTKVNLRSNNLHGSIILGNYGYLTHLDVSENDIGVLDLSALDQLESLQCSRNKIRELTLNGRVLRSLIAGNNELTKLTITPEPAELNHLDISYNQLVELPNWTQRCGSLQTLFASHNRLEFLPNELFTNAHSSLHTVQLDYNTIHALPPMPKRPLPLYELFLQNNTLESLPDNFFIACNRLMLLNVSSNRLQSLPTVPPDQPCPLIEKIFATSNRLNDKALESMSSLMHLKVIHAAYNLLTVFPEKCDSCWPDLEELILSGNKLLYLPENLANLQHIKILRVHSNQLQSVPALARTSSLRVLDLAHNQLDKINLVSLVSKRLKFLDLSCNKQLQVDPRQLQVCRSQRAMSLVDVSGKNRSSLPSTPNLYQENADFEPPWKIGFSETAGTSTKLFISQLRLPCFCNNEGLFGIFDGEPSRFLPTDLVTAIPKILLDERTVKETAGEYMKYTLLSAHRELKDQGQRQGVCAILCHISLCNDSSAMHRFRFVLRVACVGKTQGILIRKSGYVSLTPITPTHQIGNSANFPMTTPNPEVCEIALNDQDEYLVLANKKLWEVLSPEAIVKEIRSESNVILAAKRLQDIAQSYGSEENLSLIIVKFNSLGGDSEHLMRELRQNLGQPKKPTHPSSGTVGSAFCKCGCCCEANNNCCHSGASMQFIRQPSARSDRSSPSGQSDNTAVSMDQVSSIYKKIGDTQSTLSSKWSSHVQPSDRKSWRGGVVRAVRARIEEEHEREDESDSALSEEQFKCWEYMLEQNTQLLFDKELNTISRAFTKKGGTSVAHLALPIKTLSMSSPQLAFDEHSPKPVVSQYHGSTPFLSRQFGSARSFHPTAGTPATGLFKALRFGGSDRQPIGGPNAAYFGSLQRLMPYNLEYDFAAMHERVAENDSLEYEHRMQQYWGVATTEL